MDERVRQPLQPQPAEFKTRCDGQGGLVRVRLVGPPHEGRALYIDELDLPVAIYTTATPSTFEWWTEPVHEVMKRTPTGSDPAAMPVRHSLRIPDDTREPVYESEGPAS